MEETKSRRQTAFLTSESRLKQEYQLIKAHAPLGVYVVPHPTDLRVMHGALFVRQGEYKNGVFRFRIELPEIYPAAYPSIAFITSVYHPLVHPETGDLSLKPRFPLWNPENCFVFRVLEYLKRIFYFQDHWSHHDSIQNFEAFEAHMQDHEGLFQAKVDECVLKSQASLYEGPQDFMIRFTHFSTVHQKLLDALKFKDKETTEEQQCDAFMRWFKTQFL